MAAITKAEIVTLAFTRNVSTDHITDADVSVATAMYVDAYVDDVTSSSTIYDDYVKPVIAYGVAVNIFDRIASEITDRGVVQMVTDGATVIGADAKAAMKKEYTMTLNQLIKKMVDAADDADMDLTESTLTSTDPTVNGWYEVGFTGNEKQGTL